MNSPNPTGRKADGHRRLLWIVNHKTLMDAEVPIFQDLGFSVFIPKRVPNDPGYRSAKIDYQYDNELELPPAALAILNEHHFYTSPWSPTLSLIINRYFDALVSSVSGYTTPIFEAIDRFEGLIVARVFGRENPARYTSFFSDWQLDAIKTLDHRFLLGQGFGNLAHIEDGRLAARAKTIPLAIPQMIWERSDTWTGKQTTALLLCPNIMDSPYYRNVYEALKDSFGHLPHVIMGRQNIRPTDPAVLPYMTDGELLDLYSRVSVFVYPSTEPRHVHYSPIEAMIVGCPVLYLRGGLLDFLAAQAFPGCCEDVEDMQEKASRLLGGDKVLSDAIRESQHAIVDTFSTSESRLKWQEALASIRAKPTLADVAFG
ncbi:glycosyltransferase [Mesorhizobium sp. 1B3]|uniref:glycosyltransferase n=1 Tax=Mesorhizobium sp. 1B3 TaxID=3243599 RepID=UPI003D96043F